MRIIILGPTGSGKGTQAKLIAKLLRLKHIEAGELLRKQSKKNELIKKLVDRGRLITDEIIIKLIKEKIKNNKDFILDGFPRTLTQLKSLKFKPDLVLFLKVNKDNLIKRLSLRKRFDDTKENILERYHIYLKQTMPVINYYKKSGNLITINGNPTIKVVSKDIKKFLINIKYQQQP